MVQSVGMTVIQCQSMCSMTPGCTQFAVFEENERCDTYRTCSGYFAMSGMHNYRISFSASRQVKAGYSKFICMKCTHIVGITKKSVVQIIQSNLDCSQYLTPKDDFGITITEMYSNSNPMV